MRWTISHLADCYEAPRGVRGFGLAVIVDLGVMVGVTPVVMMMVRVVRRRMVLCKDRSRKQQEQREEQQLLHNHEHINTPCG